MAEFTENLNLELPAKTEQYNIAVQNSNMKKIDDFSKLTPPRALTADKLTAGVKINDIFFDGTEDIQITTGGGGLTMFAHIWSDHIYNDISYLRADTFSWHYASIYKTGYEILEEQYNHEKSVQKTENGIIYRLTPDKFKIADITQQDAIRTLYETTGIAWYYIIDTKNKCFKLPRTKWGFVGVRDEVGKPVEATAPNIRGSLAVDGADALSGAFYDTGELKSYSGGDSNSSVTNFDASRSNPIYKDGATVQPPATQQYLYFYVGQSKRPETEVNLGETSEALNNKVDLDAENYKGSELENYVNDTCLNDKRTNCITEIPQRIKYTLENGILTIKAGSVVIVPYGVEDKTAEIVIGSTFLSDNFKVVDTCWDGNKFFVWTEIQVDKPCDLSSTTDGTTIVFCRIDGFIYGNIKTTNCISGTTAPTSSNYMFYNTTDNKVLYTSNGAMTEYVWSLPLGIINVASSVVASIQQTFNGMGYIGSTIWVEKGVKGLIPNGRNEDGTLNNIEYTSDKVFMRTFVTSSNGSEHLIFAPYNLEMSYFRGVYTTYCITQDNYLYNATNEEFIQGFVIGKLERTSNGTIISFQLKQPFRALDYNDKSEIIGWGYISNKVQNLTLGATGTIYTAPANGKFWVEKTSGKAGAFLTMYSNNHTAFARTLFAHSTNDLMRLDIDVIKGQQIVVTYNATGATSLFRFIYAQGEINE